VKAETGLLVSVPYNSGAARQYFGGLSYDGHVAGILYIHKYNIICFLWFILQRYVLTYTSRESLHNNGRFLKVEVVAQF
jgi:hypothetical protein